MKVYMINTTMALSNLRTLLVCALCGTDQEYNENLQKYRSRVDFATEETTPMLSLRAACKKSAVTF